MEIRDITGFKPTHFKPVRRAQKKQQQQQHNQPKQFNLWHKIVWSLSFIVQSKKLNVKVGFQHLCITSYMVIKIFQWVIAKETLR